MRIPILKAIIERETLEYIYNPQAIILLGLTLLINALLFFSLGGKELAIPINMSLVLMGCSNTMMLFAEEKDQKTFSALLITPASFKEIIIGKLFVNFFITFFCSIFLLLFLQSTELAWFHLICTLIPGALIFCLFGMALGLIVTNQKVASSLGSLLVLTLFLPELLAPLNPYIAALARGIPTYYINSILKVSKYFEFSELLKYYIPLLTFLLLIIFFVISVMKSYMKQEQLKWKFSSGNIMALIALFISAIISSHSLKPIEWQNIILDGKKYLSHEGFVIKIPDLESEHITKKLLQLELKNVVTYENKDENFYLFLRVDRNLKKLPLDKYINEKIKDLTKNKKKGISHIERMENSVVFNDNEGANQIHFKMQGKWIFQTGIVAKDQLSIPRELKNRLLDFDTAIQWQ